MLKNICIHSWNLLRDVKNPKMFTPFYNFVLSNINFIVPLILNDKYVCGL